ncbi:MAG: cell division protease FtsH [Acidimicrobiaceae bacterium]|nr:cell division protease FtsH [Acidimicrobiaceae bacterium]
MDLERLTDSGLLDREKADVGVSRERARLARLSRLLLILSPVLAFLWWRIFSANPIKFPHLTPRMLGFLPLAALIVLLGAALLIPMIASGRSPHVLFRPEEIDVGLDDVKGAPVVVEEIVKSLNLFLAHKTFHDRMGGNPRRAMLFEGPPGTGKTYLAKAMAREAGVPFLFVSSSAFQSMFYGQTNKRIRSYFKALRAAARREGGAIGFIEEIDAIGASRSGTGGSTQREGIAGVVNELLIQLQSFDTPPTSVRFRGAVIELFNRLLPVSHRLAKPIAPRAHFLLIGATNRAADLDAALLRPGRFDRSIYFDLPSRAGRRELFDYYLAKKAHAAELDESARRDTLAAMTFGYSPVMIEHLLDEALVWALRRGHDRLSWDDVQRAKMTEEIGLAQPVDYTEAERRTIATHESGHATVAWLVGGGRKLEVLSIIKRKDALGLLAHSEAEERYLKARSEMHALIQIALGGMVAEEIFFGETTSGALSDLKVATSYAANMVGAMGMEGTLFSYEAIVSPHANLVAKLAASEGGQDRVEALLSGARDEVREMLNRNRHVIEHLRDALLERDELIGPEILEVINTAAAGDHPPMVTDR